MLQATLMNEYVRRQAFVMGATSKLAVPPALLQGKLRAA